MITHNGKQVTLAMRNRKAINLIARNGKAMFGELRNPGYFYGIDAAANAVILAEYGKQVWSDVKQYAKAHPAIVPFINQDPHLACSISTNSNKERWLVGDGKAYIDTGVVPIDATLYEVVGSINPTSNSSLLGLHIGTSTYNYIAGYLTNAQFKGFVVNWGTGSHFQEVGVKDANLHRHKFDRITGEYNVDDNSTILTVGTTASTDTLKLFANSPYNQRCSGNVVECKMSNGTTPIREMYPTIHNGECGMVDAISGTFHPNANTSGQFTIAITDKE